MQGWIAALAVGLCLGMVAFGTVLRAEAQPRVEARPAASIVNLFATLEADRPVDGFAVRLPSGWTLQSAAVLRFGSTPVPMRRMEEAGTVVFVAEAPLDGPHDVVLQVETGSRTGRQRWSVRPFVRTDAGRRTRTRLVREEAIEIEPRPRVRNEDAANHVLRFTDTAGPVVLPPEAVPEMGRAASFTVEAWMKTVRRDQVVLSTWTGDEAEAYPLEVVVDASGRLRAYAGRPGDHRAVVTPRPAATGTWQHWAVVYDADRRVLRLLMNGTPADSITAITVPTPRRGRPAALAGRPLRGQSGEVPGRTYAGELDEVRLWDRARSAASVRRTMRRPLPAGGDGLRVRLGFEDESGDEGPMLRALPSGATRAVSDLSFTAGLRDLSAEVTGATVRLTWTADAGPEAPFVIQRSTDGTAFTTLAERTPDAADVGATRDGRTYTYTDDDPPGQVVYYRIQRRTPGGALRTSGTLKIGLGRTEAAPSGTHLQGTFPNPFTASTTVAYQVHEPQPVTITVWNVTGNRIARLADGVHSPGYYEKTFQADDLPSGTYFVRLQTPDGVQSHQMVLVK